MCVFFRTPKETFDPAEFPSSYKENLPNENLVLQFAENFRRQYVHLYRDRKPLLLNPVNECFVEVCFFCTLTGLMPQVYTHSNNQIAFLQSVFLFFVKICQKKKVVTHLSLTKPDCDGCFYVDTDFSLTGITWGSHVENTKHLALPNGHKHFRYFCTSEVQFNRVG